MYTKLAPQETTNVIKLESKPFCSFIIQAVHKVGDFSNVEEEIAPTNQKTLTSIDTHADTKCWIYFTKFRTGFARIKNFQFFPF